MRKTRLVGTAGIQRAIAGASGLVLLAAGLWITAFLAAVPVRAQEPGSACEVYDRGPRH